MTDVALHRDAPAGRPRSPIRFLVPAALVLGAATIVALIAWMPAAKPPEQDTVRPPTNVRVQTIVPVPELRDTLTLTAIVEPMRVVKVAAEVAARIERYATRSKALAWRGKQFDAGVMLDEGQPVAAGDPIMYLNRELLDARYDRAQSQFEFDDRELRRVQGLYDNGATSRQELDDARTHRDMSKASLDEIVAQRERCTIVAPISGILNKLPMEVGEYPQVGNCVAEIVENDIVKIVVEVPERDVKLLKLGDVSEVAALDDPNLQLSGAITYIDALASSQTRSTRVEITIPDPTGKLHTGQIVRAELTRRRLTDVIMIPLAAVIPLEVGYEAYVVVDGTAQRREVELGFIQGRDVRVTKGLSGGDTLIIEGHRLVSDGQAVRVVE